MVLVYSVVLTVDVLILEKAFACLSHLTIFLHSKVSQAECFQLKWSTDETYLSLLFNV